MCLTQSDTADVLLHLVLCSAFAELTGYGEPQRKGGCRHESVETRVRFRPMDFWRCWALDVSLTVACHTCCFSHSLSGTEARISPLGPGELMEELDAPDASSPSAESVWWTQWAHEILRQSCTSQYNDIARSFATS